MTREKRNTLDIHRPLRSGHSRPLHSVNTPLTRGRNAPRPAAVTHATPVHGPPNRMASQLTTRRRNADVLRHGPCGRHHRVGIRIPTRTRTAPHARRGSNHDGYPRARSRTVAIARPRGRGIKFEMRALVSAAGTARCRRAWAPLRAGGGTGARVRRVCARRRLPAPRAPPTNVRPTAMDQCAADYTLGSSTRHAHHNATRIRPTKPRPATDTSTIRRSIAVQR